MGLVGIGTVVEDIDTMVVCMGIVFVFDGGMDTTDEDVEGDEANQAHAEVRRWRN